MRKLRLIVFSFIILIASFSFNLQVGAQAGIVNPNKVYSYNQMVTDINKLKRTYPDLIQVKIIGKSEFGRNLYAVSLGKGPATIFVNGSHHAREWLTTTLNMYMIDQYAQAYQKNQVIKGYNARTVLNSTTIWFIPMVNPDGVTLQQEGLKAFPTKYHNSLIKMNGGSKNFKRWKANGKGVDLNRQYNAGWKAIKSPSVPSYKNYKGKAPESAAETKAVLMFVSTINPEMALSYHSSGKILFWNYKQGKSTYNRDYSYAKTIGRMTGYRLIFPGKNPSGGGFTDWFIETKKRPAFTPEISRSVYETSPPLSEFSGAWKENQAVGLYTASESFKLFDLRMKKETDRLAGQLSKLLVKSRGLRSYYSSNVKQEKDLKIDKSFKALYDSINKETVNLERQAAKLSAKHKARVAGYLKNINIYRNESKLFIDGINAGEKLSKVNKGFEEIFAAGNFEPTTIARHTSLARTTAQTEKAVNKMYGTHVKSLASRKYISSAKSTTENTKFEINRYKLTKEIERLIAAGDLAAAKINLTRLETLEIKSKSLKESNPSQYKQYPLVEQKLMDMKKNILDSLAAKEGA